MHSRMFFLACSINLKYSPKVSEVGGLIPASAQLLLKTLQWTRPYGAGLSPAHFSAMGRYIKSCQNYAEIRRKKAAETVSKHI